MLRSANALLQFEHLVLLKSAFIDCGVTYLKMAREAPDMRLIKVHLANRRIDRANKKV
jgi:hypothetical protein